MKQISFSELAIITMGQSPKGESCNFDGIGEPLLNGPTEFKEYYPKAVQFTTEGKKYSKKGDILFCVRGSTTGRMNLSDKEYVLGRGLASISHKKNSKLNIFLKYLIQHNLNDILKNTSGSTFPNLSRENLDSFKFNLPKDLNINSINNFLSLLDSKIELNNKINKELESMSKTLYDYWFVQFDFPNENGKPYKSSGGKMVYNQELKREISEGWEVCRLEDIEDNIITGKTPPKINPEYFNGNIPFITIGDIRGNMHIVSTEETLSKLGADYQSSKYINKGALCVSCIASPGLIGFATKLSQTNQQINSLESKKEENSFYLYFALNDFFNASKAKTGNTFPNMNKGDFADIKLIKPNEQVLLSFSKKIKSSIEQIYINSEQNQELAKLRDWLLPMLMNGQVRVK